MLGEDRLAADRRAHGQHGAARAGGDRRRAGAQAVRDAQPVRAVLHGRRPHRADRAGRAELPARAGAVLQRPRRGAAHDARDRGRRRPADPAAAQAVVHLDGAGAAGGWHPARDHPEADPDGQGTLHPPRAQRRGGGRGPGGELAGEGLRHQRRHGPAGRPRHQEVARHADRILHGRRHLRRRAGCHGRADAQPRAGGGPDDRRRDEAEGLTEPSWGWRSGRGCRRCRRGRP